MAGNKKPRHKRKVKTVFSAYRIRQADIDKIQGDFLKFEMLCELKLPMGNCTADDMRCMRDWFNLVKMIIRYGEKIVCYIETEDSEEQPVTVTEYISSSLKEDDIQFHDPIHRKILKEAENNIGKENFVSERYFIAHPDPEISKAAADMANDRYQLSNLYYRTQTIITDEERLHELVPRLLLEFKISILKEEMKHTMQALNNPEIASDPQKCAEIMMHFRDLSETQNMIMKHAGDRAMGLY